LDDFASLLPAFALQQDLVDSPAFLQQLFDSPVPPPAHCFFSVEEAVAAGASAAGVFAAVCVGATAVGFFAAAIEPRPVAQYLRLERTLSSPLIKEGSGATKTCSLTEK
jgi:hypothetical protein